MSYYVINNLARRLRSWPHHTVHDISARRELTTKIPSALQRVHAQLPARGTPRSSAIWRQINGRPKVDTRFVPNCTVLVVARPILGETDLSDNVCSCVWWRHMSTSVARDVRYHFFWTRNWKNTSGFVQSAYVCFQISRDTREPFVRWGGWN